jgi:integrase
MRSRHQDGWVEERGGKIRRWYGHYYVYLKDEAGNERREHRGVLLGDKAKVRKWEAEEKLRAEIGKVVQNLLPASADQTFGWFVRERFLPLKGKWRPSTRATNLNTLNSNILHTLWEAPLAEVDKFKCQMLLNKLAEKGYSHSVVDHVRIALKAILEEAVDQELIGRNPARKLENPDCKAPQKPTLDKADARRLLNALEDRDKLIAMIASFCAMRPGEIFALRRNSFRGDHFFIENTAWRGTMQMGKAKTKGSRARVAIPDVLIPMIDKWLQSSPQALPEDLLFPSSRAGLPLWPHRWLQSHMQTVARRPGIKTKVNFQVLRRTFATNAQEHGSLKDVQTHLRHAHINTTGDIYTQPIEESVRRMVNTVTDKVLGLEGRPASERLQ